MKKETKVQIWHPSVILRWHIVVKNNREYKSLQQKWISSTNEIEWRDIETIINVINHP